MDLFAKMKLDKDVILFIDGIDIRPTQIPYEEYLDCIFKCHVYVGFHSVYKSIT